MVCAQCGTSNETDRKFCKECAARLVVACGSCGASNAPDAKFCGECAAALSAVVEASAPAPPVPVAERRLVSVLFVDLVGFTPYAEGRDAEDVREALSRWYEAAREVILRYGGTVEKYIGDAVMAVWGAPTAHEDDAERAVRAGLELVDAVRHVGPGISARAGIMTGEAAVTIGATGQGLVAGDLVNSASRLQSAAPAGGVIVDAATRLASSRAIAFEPHGEQLLRGKSSPVPAFLAGRVVAEVGGRNRADTLEAPFVGRDDEMRLLKDLFHATGREGRARQVSVVGPAGIGKSRLARELSKYLDGLVEPVYWHAGRSPAYGEGITFWALGEMVRERAGLAETDDEATTRDRIRSAVGEWVVDPDEAAWVEPALLALLGIGSPADPRQLFGAWRTFFERIAARGTVVLMFEDVHWADPGLLDFIDQLLEWSRHIPLYVVTLARPELLERRPQFGAGRHNFTSLSLEPIEEPAMRELLGGLVPGLPERAASAIVARAEGVPLYAVEIVRMLVADGRLRPSSSGFEPTNDLGALEVPATLTALVSARLDALTPIDRSLIYDAAVLGQSFTVSAVGAVSGIDEAELERRLGTLVHREFLTIQADSRSPERGQYVFVQAVIREVAYNTLARRDRRSRHLAAARYLESIGSDELAGALAGHYLAAVAHSAAGPEADAVATQARIALRAAADRAASLGSHDQVIAFVEQALSITADERDEAELRERAGVAASAAGHHDAAEVFLREATTLRRTAGDRSATARATALLGEALLNAHHVDAALESLEPAAVEFADLPGDPSVVALLAQQARALLLAAEDDRAIAVADRVLATAEALELVDVVADALITKGSGFADAGRSYEGLGLIEVGLRLAMENDRLTTSIRGRINLVAILLTTDPAAALTHARLGLEDARRLSLATMMAACAGNGFEAALWTGDWEWALGEAEVLLATEMAEEDLAFVLSSVIPLRSWHGESVDTDLVVLDRLASLTTDADSQASIALARGASHLAAGRLREAREEQLIRSRASPANSPVGYTAAARAALWMSDASAARADLAALDATLAHGLMVSTHRSAIVAGIDALEGRDADAIRGFTEAIAAARKAGIPVAQALIAIDMASVLDPALPAVQAGAADAREILTTLGAVPFLDRLERALRRTAPAQGPADVATTTAQIAR